jgi:hypothetical protein
VKAESDVTAPADAEPGASGAVPGLRTARWVGYTVLAVEFGCFAAWSGLLYDRFSLTLDFGIYHQGWYLIAHGDLNPFNSMQGHSYWQDHGEFILWPLALLNWIPPHDLMQLWVQDAAVVIAQAVAFTWICELAQRYRPGKKDAIWLAGAGLVLLVANPWTWWTVSFDFHSEPLTVMFVMLLARDLYNRRRRAWAWVAPLLACGDVAAGYLAAIGVGGLLARRRIRLPEAAMVALGVAGVLVLGAVHANQSTPLWSYAALESPPNAPFSVGALVRGIAVNPRHPALLIWDSRWDTWRSLAASGLLGVGSVCLLPLAIVTLLSNNLAGAGTSTPGFQSFALYIIVPVGTVAVLGWLARRYRLTAAVLAAAVVAQALSFTVMYGSRTKEQWLLVPAPTAATLSSVLARIPASDQVIASQGVVGRFSDRKDLQALFTTGTIRLADTPAWFIIVPQYGIETMSTAEDTILIRELSGPLHARLVTQANGVWAFRWTPPHGQETFHVP